MNIQAPLIIDIEGFALTAIDKKRLKNPLTGGIILFGRNWQSRKQLTALCADIKAVRNDLLICVDHEGGRVQRFRTDGFTHLPAMRRLGEMWTQDAKGLAGENVLKACKAASALGYLMATELRACGVDLSFTPVLDLDYGASEVSGDRAFHHDPRVVTLLAKSLNHGLALAGMANCGKHFPGHGFVAADSHIAIPVDERDPKDILKDDAAPYGWLGMSLAAVMPAHVIYPKFDKHPAGFSRKWLSLLRHDLGFDGVIFSDDLSMEGASVAGTVVDGAHAALAAGCDMVLVCNSPDKADQLLQGLDPSVSIDAHVSAQRIAALAPTSSAKDWDTLQEEGHYRAAKQLLADFAPTA